MAAGAGKRFENLSAVDADDLLQDQGLGAPPQAGVTPTKRLRGHACPATSQAQEWINYPRVFRTKAKRRVPLPNFTPIFESPAHAGRKGARGRAKHGSLGSCSKIVTGQN